MSELYGLEAYVVSGPAWTARHCDGYLLIEIDPERIDIADAVEALIPLDRRHRWTVEFFGERRDGTEVWILERCPAVSHACVTNQ